MTVLLIDVGNSRIKWALWRKGKLGKQQALPLDEADPSRLATRVLKSVPGKSLERVVVSSVAGDGINSALSGAAERLAGIKPEFVTSQRRAARVTTRYEEPWRLGVDRFVAAIGAHHIAGKRPVVVVDIGTAMTIDLVDEKGVHRGGSIVPGPELMVKSLLKNTNGIQRRSRGGAGGRGLFGRSTRAAIEQGARFAASAIIDRAYEEARATLGKAPLVLLTGGAAARVAPVARCRPIDVPDLVLRGLAVLSGLTLN